jgi:hypothetical protein
MLFMNALAHVPVGRPLSIPDQVRGRLSPGHGAKEPDRQATEGGAAKPIARAKAHLNRHLNRGIKAPWRLAINGRAMPHDTLFLFP